jgi:hypothetical protein
MGKKGKGAAPPTVTPPETAADSVPMLNTIGSQHYRLLNIKPRALNNIRT